MVSLSPYHRIHPLNRTRIARPTRASRQERRRLLGTSGGLLLAFSLSPEERTWIRVGGDGVIAVLEEGPTGEGMVDERLTALVQAQIEGEGGLGVQPLPLRIAGATIREMLLAAAAQVWCVPVSACRTIRGAVIHHETGERLPFDKLAALAALLPIPFFILR